MNDRVTLLSYSIHIHMNKNKKCAKNKIRKCIIVATENEKKKEPDENTREMRCMSVSIKSDCKQRIYESIFCNLFSVIS